MWLTTKESWNLAFEDPDAQEPIIELPTDQSPEWQKPPLGERLKSAKVSGTGFIRNSVH